MDYLFLFFLFVTAFLYASVGHGGASGYLALMAIFGFEQYVMKSSALTLNLVVSGISFYSFFRKGFFKFSLLLPFITGSVPMAFLGAKININPHTYKIILGIFLIIAVSRMFLIPKKKYEQSETPLFFVAVLIGAVVGFFSGMIGIGGGIILSPLLLLLHWSNVKETAGISALFIFLNSAAGLIGLSFNHAYEPTVDIYVWVIIGMFGGFLGGYFSSIKLSNNRLRYLLSFILFAAGIKLIIF